MKARNINIYILLTLIVSMAAVSCADDTFIDYNTPDASDSNLIRFDVSSGFDTASRSAVSQDDNDTDDDGLCPMVLSDGNDTLYLHRYVAPESKRATGNFGQVQSRATQVTTANFTSICEKFMVCAINADGTQFFPLSETAPLATDPAGDIWYIKNPKYRFWPDNVSLHFNAYAPASAALQDLDISNRDKITFNYTVPTFTDDESKRRDAEKQPDLMFASSEFTHDKNAENHSDIVPINFRHALSAIKFAVRDVTKWTIADISIINVAGSGSCTFSPSSSETGNPFVWGNLGEKKTFTQTFDYTMDDPYDPDSEDPDHEVPSKPEAPVINDEMPEKTFMLIPQTIPDEAELQITLTFGNDTKVLKGKLKTDDIPHWEAGKEYVYTISTSAINWTYVFKVMGSRQGVKKYDTTIHNWVDSLFVDNDSVIEIGSGVTKGSYYKVESYRYRTNSPDKKEILPWTAVATDGTNTVPTKFDKYKEFIPMTVLKSDWLRENWIYEDSGSDSLKLFDNLTFAPQYVATDYDGDWVMRAKGEKNGYTNGLKDPVDLSMVYGKRNTANCYVINAGGWYSIPLYYGSSIKDGEPDESTYYNDINYTVTAQNGYEGSFLKYFIDYKGNDIMSPEINTPVKDAILVWQDAYGIIDQWEYDSAKKQIVFHVDHTYLQQANCVLAIRDTNEDIIWSWHIWVTDHWVNDDLVLGKLTDREAEVKCEAEDPTKGPFDLAPYNLGWCDPKNVLYLKRSGTMTFTQTEQDGTTVLATKALKVIQRSDEIEYWIGNSTYYQFGRKDPMVGFINDKSEEKYNFGQKTYAVVETNSATIKDWILYPNAFYFGNNNKWESSKYYNLWNNYNSKNVTISGTIDTPVPKDPKLPATGENVLTTVTSGNPNLSPDFAYSAHKTIYDPSPAGYVVPPIGFFQVFGIGNPNTGTFGGYVNNELFYIGVFGEKEKIDNVPTNVDNPGGYFNYTASPRRDHTPPYSVIFNVNGQKRNSNYNMNPSVVYLWSNTNGFYVDGWTKDFASLGYALGFDTNNDFTINTYFQGTQVIARPVRCIKEFTQHY